MAISKKLRKLRRDPKAFFRDSKNPLFKSVGVLLIDDMRKPQPVAAATKPAKPAIASKAAKAPGRAQSAGGKGDLEAVRTMEAIFQTPSSADLWKAYRHGAMDRVDGSTSGWTVALYPTGVPFLDRARSRMYQEEGYSVVYLPLWEHFDQGADLDDVEFRANKAPLEANAIARKMLASIKERNVLAVVLPYDATSLTRAIAIQCRALRLVSICHFPVASSSTLELYGETRIASMPICERLVADQVVAGKMSFPARVMQRCSVLPYSADIASAFDESHRETIRAGIGAGAAEDVRLLVLPPLQNSLSNERLTDAVFAEVESLLSRTQPTDHLLIVAKRRKNGFLNGAAIKLLREKYRKAIRFYDEDGDLAEWVGIAKEVVAPEGLLGIDPAEGQSMRLYSIDEVAQDRTGASTVDVAMDLSTEGAIDGEKPAIAQARPHSSFRELIESHQPGVAIPGLSNSIYEDVLSRILDKDGVGLDVIGVPDPINNLPITEGRQKYLLELLSANRRVTGAGALQGANAAELFVQWGAEPSESKERPEVFRSELGRPRLYLEDGFIRSQGLWTDPNEPTLSVVMDTRAIYYNSLQPSLLERILNSDFELNDAQLARAKRIISDIVSNRISKYNHAPVLNLDFRTRGKRTILIVDQKAGDMSIKYGSATDESFSAMLQEALDLGEEAEIIIKQHPCAISGGAHEAHFTAESLGPVARQKNVHLIGFDVNPYSLIEAVDEVWVVSSGMGFEALMAGKKVRCFGVPFYSNWGITQNQVDVPRRQRQRSLEEIFYVFYLILSRYVDPQTGKLCEVERLIEYFSDKSEQRAA
ncbi:hypothetical protein CTP10_R45030 [Cupriavidus sp. P-10]|uniref:capsular polysaccharide export protein, LipB/KpsS family n=1 Tax=Cupriavidus sp. P-10 TaxID=2027911 RepID=UPI000E2E535B|nr:hypothetical protein [Cupriavidus sp. P-10]BDB27098.1 hypothetical protein CTP10_R45030 [Cupriavidus sp. P-10]